MPFPPWFAHAVAEAFLSQEEMQRLSQLRFVDGGHGYDPFGMHPDFVAFGEAVASPLYKVWFRVSSRGAHHIPATGPAILTANHSGTLPLDAMMLWADVVRSTNPPRVGRPMADHFVPMLPFIGSLFARAGMAGGSRGNVRKLLESGELLLIFPEGVPGISKHYAQRYHLQEWRVGHAELAIRHRAPVIPVAIVGAEEQMPQVASIRGLSLFGIPHVPITLTPIPLPVHYRILYGEPIPLHHDYAPEQADDAEAVDEAASRVKSAVEALIQEGLALRQGRIFT